MSSSKENNKEHYQEFYETNDWGVSYSKIRFQVVSYVKLIELFSRKPLKRILDIGCGTGLYTKAFMDLGYRCTGIDFAESAIKKAKEQFDGAHFLQHDATKITLDDKFDLFFASGFSPFNSMDFENISRIINQWAEQIENEGMIFILGRSDLSGKKSSSGWYFHTAEQVENMYLNSDCEVMTFYIHPLLRYVLIIPIFRKSVLKLVSYFSKNIIAKMMRRPVRLVSILIKK